MMFRLVTSLAVGAALLPGPAFEAGAQSTVQSLTQSDARQAVQTGEIIPAVDVFKMMKEEFEGQQVDLDLYRNDDGYTWYEVLWDSGEGRRLKIVVDAKSGEIVGVNGG